MRILHTMLRVGNLERSIEFYTNVIGMQLLRKLPRKSITHSFELGRLSGALEFEATQHAFSSNSVWRRLARSKLFWRREPVGFKQS